MKSYHNILSRPYPAGIRRGKNYKSKISFKLVLNMVSLNYFMNNQNIMRFVWWRIKHRAQINSTSQPVKAWLSEFRHITDTKYSYSGGGGIMRCVHICSTKVIITLLYIIDIHPHITHHSYYSNHNAGKVQQLSCPSYTTDIASQYFILHPTW